MGKKAKDHRKKVAARNSKIKQDSSRVQKMQREFIKNLIKQEQEKGLFDNNQTINPISDLPAIAPIIEGPSF